MCSIVPSVSHVFIYLFLMPCNVDNIIPQRVILTNKILKEREVVNDIVSDVAESILVYSKSGHEVMNR